MPLNLKVVADVVDLRYDDPKPDDVFVVDAMVWYWLADTATIQLMGKARPYQVEKYPPYISLCRRRKAQLRWCGLNLSELFHRIEEEEFKTFRDYAAANKAMTIKEYRHNEAGERSRVVEKAVDICEQVMQFATSLDYTIDTAAMAAALARVADQKLDGYDLFVCEAMERNKVTNIITDDADFATVPNIRVFTANRTVIDAADKQGRLIK